MKHVKQNSHILYKSACSVFQLCLGLTVVSLLLAITVASQSNFSPDDPGWDARLDQLVQFEGLIVDSVIITSQNIYDTTKANRNTLLFRTANKLHTVSRHKVIRRELLIKAGETFNIELARETARNLRIRFELYDAHISVTELQNEHIIVSIKTIDQWSTFAKLKFTKDSDKAGFRFGIEERNLAGLNQLLRFDYINPGDEDAFLIARFYDHRFSKYSFSLGFEYDDDPENIVRRLTISRPYYNLNQRWSFGTSLAELKGREDRYSDSSLVVQYHRRGDELISFVEHRWGSYRHKIGLNISHTYIFKQSFAADTIDPDQISEGMIAEDSTYHYFQLGPSFQSINYLSLKRINGMGYPEDFVYGRNYTISFGRAFRPKFDKNLYDRIEFKAIETQVIKNNLATVNFRRTIWVKNGNDIQALTDASLQWYNFNFDFMTTALRLRYQKLTREDRLNLLSLGGINGIRGYREFFKTGYRRLAFNAEARLFAGVDILTALLGGVIFWDAGRVWSYTDLSQGTAEDPFPADKASDWYYSYGLGLRISLEKSSRSQIVRIDFARAQNNQWELLIGTGQYF